MKNECSIVRDVLPLYLESMVSEGTADFVKEHLKVCAECSAEFETMKADEKTDHAGIENNEQRKHDTNALIAIKKKLKKRRILTVSTTVICLITALYIYSWLKPVTVDYGTSTIYSQDDMTSAIEVITEKFNTMDGCKLYAISYTNDDLCERELNYCNDLADDGVIFDECIIFTTRFRSPLFGGGAWSANRIYDWSWCLAREKNGPWVLLTWGVG